MGSSSMIMSQAAAAASRRRPRYACASCSRSAYNLDVAPYCSAGRLLLERGERRSPDAVDDDSRHVGNRPPKLMMPCRAADSARGWLRFRRVESVGRSGRQALVGKSGNEKGTDRARLFATPEGQSAARDRTRVYERRLSPPQGRPTSAGDLPHPLLDKRWRTGPPDQDYQAVPQRNCPASARMTGHNAWCSALAFAATATDHVAVDTHIFRLGNCTGLAPGKTRWRSNSKLLRKRIPSGYLEGRAPLADPAGRYVCTARKPPLRSAAARC